MMTTEYQNAIFYQFLESNVHDAIKSYPKTSNGQIKDSEFPDDGHQKAIRRPEDILEWMINCEYEDEMNTTKEMSDMMDNGRNQDKKIDWAMHPASGLPLCRKYSVIQDNLEVSTN